MAHEWKTVRMSAELIERVDAARGQVPLARWVASACESRLAGDDAPAGLREAVDRGEVASVRERPRVAAPDRAVRRPSMDDAALARQAALNKRKGM